MHIYIYILFIIFYMHVYIYIYIYIYKNRKIYIYFKMSYQIANVENSNSKDNTRIFSLFEAKDYRSNLKTGLSRFAWQIDELQSMMWRLSTIFYFMINS